MLKLTKSHPYAILDFAAGPAQMERWPDDSDPVGIVDEDTGTIRGAVVFCRFGTDSAEIHLATDRKKHWANRRILSALFAYAFTTLGLRRLHMPIRESNVTTITLALRLGFKFQGRIEGGSDNGENAILLGMLAEQCLWLPEPAPHSED